MTDETLDRWIGSRQACADPLTPFPAAALAAMLGHDGPPPTLPLPWHWLYAIVPARAYETGIDGHPARGGFLPPVDLPRRMWAASDIAIRRELTLGTRATRTSVVAAVERKVGRSGPLVFVTVDHEWRQAGADCLSERQTIVYREAASTPEAPAAATASMGPAETAHLQQVVTPNAVTLFRYSALTFNAHRIHYDAPYARDVEGYRGLVVHGPLIATLLVEAAAPLARGRAPRRFSFRAERPAFVDEPLYLFAREESDRIALWSSDAVGAVGMRATLDFGAHA